tara:strand:+ start:53043 stop:53228 length:186 start_codon:yes stop_codon:yes gene_type:complete
MTNIETLRMAAIAAVLAATNSSEDPSQAGRMSGESWSQDHRRMNMGMSSVMHQRSSRSPWK